MPAPSLTELRRRGWKGAMFIEHLSAPHGRRVAIGQLWQSNDPRKLKAVRVVALYAPGHALVKHVDTGRITMIAASSFTIGQRGWSLLKEAE